MQDIESLIVPPFLLSFPALSFFFFELCKLQGSLLYNLRDNADIQVYLGVVGILPIDSCVRGKLFPWTAGWAIDCWPREG